MKNFITNHLLEKTWLNESEIQIILSVIAEGIRLENPELEDSLHHLFHGDDLNPETEIIHSKSKIYLSV